MLLYWILLPIVWPLLHILWRIEVVGKENIPRGRAHVIASNHLSDLDPVYILEAVFSWKRCGFSGQLVPSKAFPVCSSSVSRYRYSGSTRSQSLRTLFTPTA